MFVCKDPCPKSDIQKFNKRVIEECKKHHDEKMLNEGVAGPYLI